MNIAFFRFGGLSPVKQESYNLKRFDEEFHVPPARYGLWAFNEKFYERYLIAKDYFHPIIHSVVSVEEKEKISKNLPLIDGEFPFKYQSVWKNKKVRDYYYNNDLSPEDAKKFCNENMIYVRYNRPRKFYYNGNLWHHLVGHVKHKDIIDMKGSWILTSMETYKKAIQCECGVMKEYINRTGIPFSKDHMEVFIERIK